MLSWHILMSRTQSACSERICSLSGHLVKLPTFIDTMSLPRESKGQGCSVGVLAGHGFHLAPVGPQIYSYRGQVYKSGQIYAQAGDYVAAWFGCERSGGYSALLNFHCHVYRHHRCRHLSKPSVTQRARKIPAPFWQKEQRNQISQKVHAISADLCP